MTYYRIPRTVKCPAGCKVHNLEQVGEKPLGLKLRCVECNTTFFQPLEMKTLRKRGKRGTPKKKTKAKRPGRKQKSQKRTPPIAEKSPPPLAHFDIDWPPEFTEKKKQFCVRYALHCNSARAAREAGYSQKKTCSWATGSALLRNVSVRKAINQLLEQNRDMVRVTREEIIEGLREIWESSAADFVTIAKDGEVKIDPELAQRCDKRVLRSLGVSTNYDKDGNLTRATVKPETYDRVKAIELAARLAGLVDQNKLELSGDIILQTTVADPPVPKKGEIPE